MKKTTLCFCFALAVGSCLMMTGCASPGGGVTVIQGGDSGKITDRVLDTEDFRVKGEEMVNSLIESGVLDKATQHPAVIAIGRITSNAGTYVDTDLLMKKISVRLLQSGKAVRDTSGGVLNTLDFTFSGKIIDTYVTSGNKKQDTYTFQLSLTDNRGLAVWEDEKEVTKRTKRGSMGL
jgi:hypothetical protein